MKILMLTMISTLALISFNALGSDKNVCKTDADCANHTTCIKIYNQMSREDRTGTVKYTCGSFWSDHNACWVGESNGNGKDKICYL